MSKVTLLDLAKRTGNDASVGIVESMSQSNALLSLLPFRGITGTQMKYGRRVGLPTVGFTGYNEGIAPSKSTIEQVSFETKILKGSSTVDKLLAEADPRGVNAVRAEEDAGFAAAFANAFNENCYYGDSATVAREFDGLVKILPSLVAGGNVLGAGGSSTNSSIYAFSFADANTAQGRRKGVEGIIANGGSQVINMQDMGLQKVTDAGGSNQYWAYETSFEWLPGFVVYDTQSVGRIANINGSYKPTIALLNQLVTNMHPFRPDVFLCNKTVFSYIQELKGTTWVTGFGGSSSDLFTRVLTFDGIPIMIDENITSTETTVS